MPIANPDSESVEKRGISMQDVIMGKPFKIVPLSLRNIANNWQKEPHTIDTFVHQQNQLVQDLTT